MKKIAVYFCCASFVLFITGCRTIEKITQPQTAQDRAAGTSPLPPYSGLKARIAVADFDIKA
ncbi:MAG: hypothetical protein PHT59_06195, partial [Candidatus Omnitrophica bacterium]|nr:hypothetical protein [Candidatus Omnitrophota bacterium]